MNIKIYDQQKMYLDDRIPSVLIERIQWLTDKLNSIPEPYRHTAEVHMEAFQEYDCHLIEYIISYDRPETDQERADRLEGYRQRKEDRRIRELALLRQLKEKYE